MGQHLALHHGRPQLLWLRQSHPGVWFYPDTHRILASGGRTHQGGQQSLVTPDNGTSTIRCWRYNRTESTVWRCFSSGRQCRCGWTTNRLAWTFVVRTARCSMTRKYTWEIRGMSRHKRQWGTRTSPPFLLDHMFRYILTHTRLWMYMRSIFIPQLSFRKRHIIYSITFLRINKCTNK